MLGSQLETAGKTTLSFLGVCEDWLLVRVDVEKLQLFLISYFNLAGWTIITCMNTRSSAKVGLSKQKICNVFNSQEVLDSPFIVIEKYSGVRNGKIPADFYDDCQNIPDPSPYAKEFAAVGRLFFFFFINIKGYNLNHFGSR